MTLLNKTQTTSPTSHLILITQLILKKSGGRSSKNGDPKWEATFETLCVHSDPVAKTWKEFDAGVLSAVKELESDGGGFTSCGPCGGRASSIHRTYTYMVKCLFSHCLGCPKKVKIVEDLNKE